MRSSSAISARNHIPRAATSTPKRAFDRAGESDRIGDRAVAGGPRRQLRAPRSSEAPAISASTPLWTYPSLSSRRTIVSPPAVKSKMPGLDDAGMHGADRNLMQPLALGGEESVGRNVSGRRRSRAERREDRPTSMVQPRPRIRRADRAHSRTNPVSRAPGGSPEHDRRRPMETFPLSQTKLAMAISPRCSVEQRHMDHAGVAPQSGKGPEAVAQADGQDRATDRRRPTQRGQGRLACGRMRADKASFSVGMSFPRSAKKACDMLKPGDQRRRQIDPGHQDQPEDERRSAG